MVRASSNSPHNSRRGRPPIIGENGSTARSPPSHTADTWSITPSHLPTNDFDISIFAPLFSDPRIGIRISLTAATDFTVTTAMDTYTEIAPRREIVYRWGRATTSRTPSHGTRFTRRVLPQRDGDVTEPHPARRSTLQVRRYCACSRWNDRDGD